MIIAIQLDELVYSDNRHNDNFCFVHCESHCDVTKKVLSVRKIAAIDNLLAQVNVQTAKRTNKSVSYHINNNFFRGYKF